MWTFVIFARLLYCDKIGLNYIQIKYVSACLPSLRQICVVNCPPSSTRLNNLTNSARAPVCVCVCVCVCVAL